MGREPKTLTLPSESWVRTLNSEKQAQLQVVIAEMKMLSRCFYNFQNKLVDADWERLLECASLKQRLQQVRFWYRKGELKKKDQLKAETARRVNSEACRSKTNSFRNCFLMLPSSKTDLMRKRLEIQRYMRSLVIEPLPVLAVDCQFLKCHSPRGLSLTFIQLKQLISDNRLRRRPWPLYFFNADFDDKYLRREREKHLNVLDSASIAPVEVFKENVTQIFPHCDVIYLSPHAEIEMCEIRGSEVFVIGGIVDRVREHGMHPHASLLAAEELGVSTKKLPLDQYMKWKSGTKSLTLTAVSNILYDVYTTDGDWEYALKRNIPKRNVRDPSEKNPVFSAMARRRHDYDSRIIKEVTERLRQENNFYENCGR